MTTPLYRIRDWDSVYETAETRKLENLRWVPVRNKHDGLGFRRVVAHRERCELFTAWILIVEVASKGKRGERAKLQRDGVPMDAEDLALMTGFPSQIFEKALTFFSDPKQGWLIVERNGDISASPASASEQSGGSPDSPASSPGRPADASAEWKGREGNGMEGKETAAPIPITGDEIPLPNVLLTEAFKAKWAEWIAYRRERRLPKLVTASVKSQWAQMADWGHDASIEAIDLAIRNNWAGVHLKHQSPAQPSKPLAPMR